MFGRHDSEEEEIEIPLHPPTNRYRPANNTSSGERVGSTNTPAPAMTANTSNPGENPASFQQPGRLTDINGQSWSATVSSIINEAISETTSKRGDARFYNHSLGPAESVGTKSEVRWLAYPKNLEHHAKDRWKLGDDRDKQDEYCEWEVTRNGEGKVVKVVFTCEVPEWWQHLAAEDPERLLQLYREVTKQSEISRGDLFDAEGKYNKDNKWNYKSRSNTIAHMRVKNNTLKEAVELGVDATIVRVDQEGSQVTCGRELLEYLPPGYLSDLQRSQRRHSDPTIMEVINEYAREGDSVAVDECPGLYIDEFEGSEFTCPDRKGAERFWKFTRGEKGKYIRAEFEVPPSYGFVVGDIKAGRDQSYRRIEYGSQLAQHVWVRLDILHRPTQITAGGEFPIYQYIEGRDIEPFELDAGFIDNTLGKEWFGKYLSGKTAHKEIAKTFSSLLEQLPDYTWRGYGADEGIGIKIKTPRQGIRVRLVILCTPDTPTEPPGRNRTSKVADIKELVKNSFESDTLAIVAVPPEKEPTNVDSPKAFLQVASFSKELGLFHFYDRERTSPGRWLYFGSSADAFSPDTQGLGVFCGHANGGIVMKEIDKPWVHWHTDENPLRLPPDHPLSQMSALKESGHWNFGKGEDMARMISRGNKAWYDTRMKLDFGPDIFAETRLMKPFAVHVNQWMAHILLTTSINIRVSLLSDAKSLTVPRGFFFNREALGLCIPEIGEYEEELTISAIPRPAYETARGKLGLCTMLEYGDRPEDDKQATESEAQSPWKVLVPGQEDTEGITRIIEIGLLSPKEVAALLMVDFCNPIFSWRRAHLMRYVSSTARFVGQTTNYGAAFTRAVRGIADASESDDIPEAIYIRLIDHPDEEFNDIVVEKLRQYIKAINRRIGGKDPAASIEGYLKVAESKRRVFKPPPRSERPKHPLAEFDMALPYARKLPDSLDPWEMTTSGSVAQQPISKTIWHPRNAQAHFSSSGCPFSSSE